MEKATCVIEVCDRWVRYSILPAMLTWQCIKDDPGRSRTGLGGGDQTWKKTGRQRDPMQLAVLGIENPVKSARAKKVEVFFSSSPPHSRAGAGETERERKREGEKRKQEIGEEGLFLTSIISQIKANPRIRSLQFWLSVMHGCSGVPLMTDSVK